MRNRGVTGEQWSTCDRCGRDFPMSYLSQQKGLWVCEQDFDDLDLERHANNVAKVLNASQGTEGTDLRFINDNIATLDEDL